MPPKINLDTDLDEKLDSKDINIYQIRYDIWEQDPVSGRFGLFGSRGSSAFPSSGGSLSDWGWAWVLLGPSP